MIPTQYKMRLRSCLHCGSLFTGPLRFCEFCEIQLMTALDLRVRAHSTGFSFKSVFLWKQGEGQVISTLVKAQKGQSSLFTGQKWKDLIEQSLPPGRFDAVIPAPSANNERAHAMRLAKVVGELRESPVFNCLALVANDQSLTQKKRDRVRRQEIRFELKSGLGLPPLAKRVLFVDDVLTTGSTALAAARALGPHVEFSAWVMAYRR